MLKRMLIGLTAILAAALTPLWMPSAAAVPAGCLPPGTGGAPGAMANLCAMPTTEAGLTTPPREESIPGTLPGRGPGEPDPGGDDPEPDPVTLPTPVPTDPALPGNACDPGVSFPGRFISCQKVEVPTTLYRPSTGEILGRGKHEITTKTTRNPNQLIWRVEYTVKTTLTENQAAFGTFRARIYYSECDQCQIQTVDGSTKDIPLNTPVTFASSMTTRVGPNASITARPRARIVITHSNAIMEADNDLGPGRYTRCDRITYISGTGGCINPAAIPTFHLPLGDARWSQVAAHILQAQIDLPKHFGFDGLGRPLQRITDPSWMRLNGRVACKDVPITRGVTSCDEYPFRSTRQGAAFEGRVNTSRAVVPRQDNSEAGGQLSGFYSTSRVISGDQFWVKID